MREGVCVLSVQWLLPDNSREEKAVGSVVVSGVVVAPQLRPGQREVPELINETAHSLLLRC